jgi:hypothetical protein
MRGDEILPSHDAHGPAVIAYQVGYLVLYVV